MTTLLATVAAFVVPMILLVSVAEHLSRPTALVRALTAHRVLPAAPLIAAATIAAEALLGGAVLLGLFHPDGARPLAAALAGSAALFLLYGGYALLVSATGQDVPCGCSRTELPMSGWVVIRALVLAAVALTGALLSHDALRPGDGPLGAGPEEARAVVLIAAVAFTALLWHLPAAMDDPSGNGPNGNGPTRYNPTRHDPTRHNPTRPARRTAIGPQQEGRSG